MQPLKLKPFLTAYDPSDLPGGSVDPLGFESGYLALADNILPGFTNVANQPRYFSVLCAGIFLTETRDCASPREATKRKLEALMRLERIWALGNVLASESEDGSVLPSSGIRGVRYASRLAKSVQQRRAKKVSTEYRLLSRQAPYGVLGIYGAVADGMRYWRRKTADLSPDLGERLAEGFIKETEMPADVRRAVSRPCDVSVDRMTRWAVTAHIASPATDTEKSCLRDAVLRHPLRARMLKLLRAEPAGENDTEQHRLKRILGNIRGNSEYEDFEEAIQVILAYEDCYGALLLAFERMLWTARERGSFAFADLPGDKPLSSVHERIPAKAKRLQRLVNAVQTPDLILALQRQFPVLRFVEDAATSATPAELGEVVLHRHTAVQHGKYDRGRRKMPWLESVGGSIQLTATRVGGLQLEPRDEGAVTPHPYRLETADQFNRAMA